MKYYYLIASWPWLRFGSAPPMSLDAFIFQCTGILKDEDMEELEQMLAFNQEGCRTPFAKDYLTFERGLRFGISGIRAGRLGLDAARFIDYERGYDTFVNRAVIDGFAKSDPRERAWVFDQTRWYMTHELSQYDPFGLPSVLAAALRIRIQERWNSLRTDQGLTLFEQQLERLLDAAAPEAS